MYSLDTYYGRNDLKTRLAQIQRFGAVAVVLLLHSNNAKEENLDVDQEDVSDDEDEEDGGKKKKRRKSKAARDIVSMAGQSALSSIQAQAQQLIQMESALGLEDLMIFSGQNGGFGMPSPMMSDLSRIRAMGMNGNAAAPSASM